MNDEPTRESGFEGLEAVRPPAELRSRTMAAARAALAVSDREPIWARMVRSRGLRAVWAATVIALVLAHVAISLPEPASRPARNDVTPLLASTTDPDVIALISMTRMRRMTRIDTAVEAAIGPRGADSLQSLQRR
jgi:hypothetical protein